MQEGLFPTEKGLFIMQEGLFLTEKGLFTIQEGVISPVRKDL